MFVIEYEKIGNFMHVSVVDPAFDIKGAYLKMQTNKKCSVHTENEMCIDKEKFAFSVRTCLCKCQYSFELNNSNFDRGHTSPRREWGHMPRFHLGSAYVFTVLLWQMGQTYGGCSVLNLDFSSLLLLVV